MKKSLLTLLGAGLLLTSCQSDEPFAPGEGDEKQVTFTLNVPGELGTRADTEGNNSGVGGWSNTQGNVSYTLVLSAEGHNQTYKKENVAGNTVTFSPTVVLGREYTVTAYAHFSDKAQENLTSITETKGINDESKDVYFFTTKENVSKPTINFAEGTSYNFDLKRPYAKLRLIAEDYNVKEGIGKPITDIKEVTVTYNNEVYTVFNAVTGQFSAAQAKHESKTWNASYYEQNVTSGDKTIFADYIPVNEIGVAPFTVTVKYTNGETYTRTFAEDIPVRRNALTTLKGAFFTAGATINVNVVDNFDGEAVNKSFVSTASQLQDAINSATPGETTEIILDGDIDLTQPIVFGPSVNPAPAQTRSEETTTNNYVLKLNGKTIVGRVPKSVGHVIEIRPGATLNVIGGTISSTAENGGSAIYNAGTLEVDGTTIVGASVRENEGWPSYPINNYSDMTLKNVTITGYQGAIACNSAGTTTLENCTINKEYLNTSSHVFYIDNADANVVVNGGTYTHKGMDGSLAYVIKGSITVNGGTFSASNGGYGMAAKTNGSITVNGGTFEAGFIDWGGNITLKGGEFAVKPDDEWISEEKAFAQNVNGKWEVVNAVAKVVGKKGYATINEAIAAWTNNTTLTLLSDVTLTDVVTLKSTEHHTLNLGTYTMTAASGKDAIEILPMGVGTAAKQCLTINADATNPGGVTAAGKSCIYYHNSEKIADRMTITINGGVFNGNYAIQQLTGPKNNWGLVNSPLRGQGAAYCVINGGTFNAQVYLNAGMLKVKGGVFHKNLTCMGDQTAHRLISGGRFKSMTMTADAANKFAIGTAKETYDVGLYVDDEGYLVVGGPVITEFGDRFAAKATNPTKWSSYLQYSSAAEHGLYYTNAEMAKKKHGEANVEVKQ